MRLAPETIGESKLEPTTNERITANAVTEAVVSLRVAEKSMTEAAVSVEALSRFISHTPELDELYDVPKLGTAEMVACVALAHIGSFTKSAIELGYSQPGFSRQIQRAEKRYGKLFTRTASGAEPTPNGHIVLEAFIEALKQLAKAAVAMETASDQS